MISTRISLIVIFLLISSVSVFIFCFLPDGNGTNQININNSVAHSSVNISSNSSSNRTLESNITNHSIDDENLVLPSEETILNCINWSNYPLLRNPYIHNHEISDPTFVINHKFLYVTIVVEVINTKNETEVLRQLSDADRELQKILGPDSGPNIWGTADGVWVYYAAIMPYETDVWARAFH